MVYWVLEIGFLPRFKCQLLCQVAFHYARRHSKKSSLPIAIIPPLWRAVIQQLFSFSHLNSTEIIWFHISANQCGEKIIALVRVGRPSSFGDKLELRGLSATKIEPSGGGSSLEWNHWEGRCNFNWTRGHYMQPILIRLITVQLSTNKKGIYSGLVWMVREAWSFSKRHHFDWNHDF